MNGEEEVRRRERRPKRLFLGDLPAAAGAEDGSALFGLGASELRTAFERLGVDIGLLVGSEARTSVKALFEANWDDFPGFNGYSLKFLGFLLDDKIEGSTFSESLSSNDGEIGRLTPDAKVTGRAEHGLADERRWM